MTSTKQPGAGCGSRGDQGCPNIATMPSVASTNDDYETIMYATDKVRVSTSIHSNSKKFVADVSVPTRLPGVDVGGKARQSGITCVIGNLCGGCIVSL